ncbi:MAG: hypothetical protein ABJP76_01520, partial [Flavobacteriaceae bacterium]
QKRTSFSSLVQPVDSIPPAMPKGLEGLIDSLGIVHIKWDPNAERDLQGYRVFRGFKAKEEVAQRTVSPILNNSFTDTVALKSLNDKVFYRVVAVDNRHNHSKMSETLILEKPDVVPPTPPVFRPYKVSNDTIRVSWHPSSEVGVRHLLYRKEKSAESKWKEIYKGLDTVTTFLDTGVETGKTYEYRIRAVDKAGLVSEPSPDITIKKAGISVFRAIREFGYYMDRENGYIELYWRTGNVEVSEFTLYKQEKDKKPTTWRVLPSNIVQIVDTELLPNKTYIYHLRPTMENGKYAKMETLEIKF